jgi:hypothetical protein
MQNAVDVGSEAGLVGGNLVCHHYGSFPNFPPYGKWQTFAFIVFPHVASGKPSVAIFLLVARGKPFRCTFPSFGKQKFFDDTDMFFLMSNKLWLCLWWLDSSSMHEEGYAGGGGHFRVVTLTWKCTTRPYVWFTSGGGGGTFG